MYGTDHGITAHQLRTALFLGCTWLGVAGCNVGELVTADEPEAPPVDTSASDSTGGNSAPRATRVVFDVHPRDLEAGDTIRPPVRVVVKDEQGQTASAFTGRVTVAIAIGPDGGTLAGTRSRDAVDGVATFDDLSIERASPEYTLEATADGLDTAVSDPFAVMPGLPASLAKVAGDGQSDSVAATLPDPYVIAVTDAHDNAVPGARVTWRVVKGEGSIAADGHQTDAEGRVSATHTFGTVAGEQAVVATVDGMSGTAVTFVSHARAAHAQMLEIVQQPTNSQSNTVITPPVVARLVDQFGNIVTQFREPVVVRLAPLTGTPLAQLNGTLTRQPVKGVVTFDDLSVDLPGLNYRLRVTAPGLTRDSRAFDVF